MLEELIERLLLLFKLLSFLGFIVTGALAVGFAYKKYKEHFDEEEIKKYRWLFILGSVFLFAGILYMYVILYES